MINVFGGRGFVGSHFCASRSDIVINDRDDFEPKTKDIIYFISTVDNYNVLTDPHLDIYTNLHVLMEVLTGCKEGDTFNFISSWFVYGDTELPAKEESYCNPKGFYSITKRAAEQLLISYCKTFKINYRILRLANVVGKGDTKVSKQKNALQFLIEKIKNNEPIQLYDNGLFIRDYIHVSDAVKAINLVLEKGELNQIYNIGNGEPIVFKDLIDYTIKTTKSNSEVGTMEPTEFHKIIQVASMYMDNARLKSLGYQPMYDKYKIIESLI